MQISPLSDRQDGMAMSVAFAYVLLLQSLSAALGKYVYVPDKMRWPEAQSYCQDHHTDLAPVSGGYDMKKILELFPGNLRIWIGLERNSSERETWLWSGGGKVLQSFWKHGEPNGWNKMEDNAMMDANGWYDVTGTRKYPFICFQATVVRERKNWEGALEHCRRDHCDLASVASHTEMLLIQKELEKGGTSEEAVWTGLRMLMDDWLWVDGQPLDYQAWGAEGRPTCPMVRRCGGLHQKTAGTSMAEPKWEWEAYDCNREFYFICY